MYRLIFLILLFEATAVPPPQQQQQPDAAVVGVVAAEHCSAAAAAACLALIVLRRAEAAAAAAAAMVADAPACAAAYHCGGAAQHSMGFHDRAARFWFTASALEPSSLLYAYNLAVMLEATEQFQAAADAYSRVLALAAVAPPGEVAACAEMVSKARYLAAVNLAEAGQHAAAVAHAAAMLAAAPVPGAAPGVVAAERVVLRCSAAYTLLHLNRPDDAQRVVAEGASEAPVLHVKAAMTGLSVIPSSVEEIVARRAAVEAAIAAVTAGLANGSIVLGGSESPLALGSDLLYYATYHGLNDAPLRTSVAALFQRAFPSLSYVSPALQQQQVHGGVPAPAPCHDGSTPSSLPPPPRERRRRRVRVGFVTAYSARHSVTKMFSRLMCGLPRELFEVVLFAHAVHSDVREVLWCVRAHGAARTCPGVGFRQRCGTDVFMCVCVCVFERHRVCAYARRACASSVLVMSAALTEAALERCAVRRAPASARVVVCAQ
jgi:hypothetical protein